VEFDLNKPEFKHLAHLADEIRQRKPNIRVRGANLKDMDAEIGRILDLQNRGLAHFPNFTPYTRGLLSKRWYCPCWRWSTRN